MNVLKIEQINPMALPKLDYLTAMGIQSWQQRQSAALPDAQPTENLISLCTTAAHCTACSLHKTRTQTVFGAGNPDADLMIISDAPGFYEDQKGEPFAGQAGQLLNLMLRAIGLDRSAVYITTLLKCRLPDNRDPLIEEINQCSAFLTKQIALIQPKVLLVFGQVAAQQLLNTQTPLEQLRGKSYTYGRQNIPLIVTYHPAHLLLNPRDKRNAWQDLRMLIIY